MNISHPRAIVQVAVAIRSPIEEAEIFVVSADGLLWVWHNREWKAMAPLPGWAPTSATLPPPNWRKRSGEDE